MRAALQYYYYGQGGVEAPAYTNWWQGMGDVVPLSSAYTIYDPLAAADLASSYINLANPGTRNAAPGVAPTHAQNSGWTFNGTTQYLDSQTKFPALGTLIVWYEGWSGVYVAGSTEVLIRPVNGTSTRLTISTNTDLAQETTGGVIGVRAQLGAYKHGVKFGNMGTWVLTSPGYTVYIGCRNAAGSPGNFGAGRVLRYAYYDFKLSDAQMEAVTSAMLSYELPADDPYSAIVLASNPICYYTCNQKYGSPLFDLSGNLAHSEVRNLPVGQAGLKGLSIAGDGSAFNYIHSFGEWATLTGFNLDEFSAACWIKVTSDATNQIRVFNIYSSTTNEYAAAEIRAGLTLGIFFKENGVITSTANLKVLTNNTWHHIVFYNSISQGIHGVYVDSVKFNVAKTAGPYAISTPDPIMPQNAVDMLGNIQHIAYWDHALSQAEVNTLYVP